MKAIATTQMTLCAALDELGAATWLEMEQGTRTRQPLEEEAITSYHLMRLAAAVPSVRLEKHTKKRESKSGADWEIWAGRPGGLLGLRVQAKMLKCDSKLPEYTSLYSSKASATKQIEKLISSAESVVPQMYPTLVFYNSLRLRTDEFSEIRCPRLEDEPMLCGWTVASAYAVRALLLATPSKHLCDLVSLMLPLSCLFCCPSSCWLSNSSREAPLAERVAAQFRKAWPGDTVDASSLIRAGPTYAERLYKGEAAGTGWAHFPAKIRRLLTQERELPKGISRVLVIRDEPSTG